MRVQGNGTGFRTSAFGAFAAAILCALFGASSEAVAQNSISLTKSASPTTYTTVGQVITYTYTVTRTGTVGTVAITNVSDNKAPANNCALIVIPANGSVTCTGTYTIQPADLVAGSVTNQATATASDGFCECFITSNTATATVTFAGSTGSITIVKAASGGDNTFSFTSTVAAATSFSLTTSGGAATRVFSSLTPGTYTFTEVNLPLNWRLSTLTCTGDNGGTPTTVNLTSRSVSIGLDGGESIVCTFGNVLDTELQRRETLDVLFRFLSHRVQLLANDEPDRNRLIRRLMGVLWDDEGANGNDPFSFTGASSAWGSQVSFSTSMSRIAQAQDATEALAYAGGGLPVKAPPRRIARNDGLDIWVEAHYSAFGANDLRVRNSGQFGVAYLGADYLINSSILVGALVQYDWMNERSRTLGSAASGNGVMAGPYTTVRLANNIFFDARAAWGVSDNRVNPFGTYQDSFDTNRWLARANLTGNWRFGDIRVTPSAGLTYVEERQKSYVDTLGVLIPGQTVALGRFDAGPEIAYRIMLASGAIVEPHISLKGVWDFQRPDTTSVAGLLVAGDELHAKVQAGVLARSPSGWSMRTVVSYDGVGSSRFHDIGGQIWVNIPFR